MTLSCCARAVRESPMNAGRKLLELENMLKNSESAGL